MATPKEWATALWSASVYISDESLKRAMETVAIEMLKRKAVKPKTAWDRVLEDDE